MADCLYSYKGKKYSELDLKSKLKEDGFLDESYMVDKNADEIGLMTRVNELIPQIKGVYKDIFAVDPKNALSEIADQANSSPSEKKGAVSAVGQEIVDIAQKLFPKQLKASPGALAKLREFNKRIGVDMQLVEHIDIGGQPGYANGVAFPYEGLIQIVNGKESIALPEESMHIAVEIIQQKNPALFKELMSHINEYDKLGEVFATYKGLKAYQLPDGRPDIIKLKKEAIGKVLADHVVNRLENQDNPVKVSRLLLLWDKIKNFLKSLFGKAGFDPFEKVAKQVTGEEEFKGTAEDIHKDEVTPFFQVNEETADKISKMSEKVAGSGMKYEVNGKEVKNTVDGKVSEFLEQKYGNGNEFLRTREDYLTEKEQKLDVETKNILDKYIDDDGSIRKEYLTNDQPSVMHPGDPTLYKTLDKNFKERIESYDPGTKFLYGKNLYDGIKDTAGKADFIAIMPDGKVDVLQFKLLSVGKGKKDIPIVTQGAYNTELTALRNILTNSYGIKDADFRQTRAIPIKVEYRFDEKTKRSSISKLAIGKVDVTLEKDDILLPVASAGETTGNKQLDRLISQFNALNEQFLKAKVSPEELDARRERAAQLASAIRRLQIQGNADKLLSSAKAITEYQKKNFDKLESIVNGIDTEKTDIPALNKVASNINEIKRELSPYIDLYKTMRAVYPKSDENGFIKRSKEISDDAKDMADDLNNLQDTLRTSKFAKFLNIEDELAPEKQLTWYRQMVRSLGQSSIKSGHELWELVKRTNGLFQRRFDDKLIELKKLYHDADKWKGAGSWDQFNKKIFAYDDKGRWKGNLISKLSPEFAKTIGELIDKAEKSGGLTDVYKTVLDHIDVDRYKAWYDKELARREENAHLTVLDPDPEKNAKMKKGAMDEFKSTYDIDKKSSMNSHNDKLYWFPKEGKWYSKEYQELLKPENAAVLNVWNWWNKALGDSYKAGIFQENWQRHGFFPNVRKDWLEKLSTGNTKGGTFDPFSALEVMADDGAFGKIDPLTGQPINELHTRFMHDLGKSVEQTDGSYYKDYSGKSQDIFKIMALWTREQELFTLRSESEDLAKLILDTEKRKKVLQTSNTGLLSKIKGKPGEVSLIDNVRNADYIQQFLEHYYYDKTLSNEADVTWSLPWGKAAKAINGFFGKEIFVEPKEDTIQLSGVKTLMAANRYFRAKVLGINALSAVSNLFGGTSNLFIKSGEYFTKKDAFKAFTELTTHRFSSTEGQMTAALLRYFRPELEDPTHESARHLSTHNMVKFLSSDWLFAGQRISDHAVNYTAAIAFFDNTILRDGKLLNIREVARRENNPTGTYKDAADKADIDAKVEAQVEDMKKNSPELLRNALKLDKDGNLEFPKGYNPEQNLQYRQRILEYMKSILGNVSHEDMSLYKRSAMWNSFFMFKNWIPRMLDERGQSLKYAPGTEKYEWGRTRMLLNSVRTAGLDAVGALMKQLTGDSEDIIKIAKKSYAEKQKYFADQKQDFHMSESEFIDSYIKGVSSGFKELGVAMGLMGIWIAMKANTPDANSDPQTKGMFKWTLRAIDKLQDEISFFYNPHSFSDLANGGVFPAIGIVTDAEKLLTNAARYGYNYATGDQQTLDKIHFKKYILKDIPITKELTTYYAIFNNDFAKENGIIIQSQSGPTH